MAADAHVYMTWPSRYVAPVDGDRCGPVPVTALVLDALYAPRDDGFPAHLQALALLGRSVVGDARTSAEMCRLLCAPSVAGRVLKRILKEDRAAREAVWNHMDELDEKLYAQYLLTLVCKRRRHITDSASAIVSLLKSADTLDVDSMLKADHNKRMAASECSKLRYVREIRDAWDDDHFYELCELEGCVEVGWMYPAPAPYVPAEPAPCARDAAQALIRAGLQLQPGTARTICASMVRALARGEDLPRALPPGTIRLYTLQFTPTNHPSQRASALDIVPFVAMDDDDGDDDDDRDADDEDADGDDGGGDDNEDGEDDDDDAGEDDNGDD